MRSFTILILGLGLGVIGCSSEPDNPLDPEIRGDGGSGGEGGSAGVGEGGAGGRASNCVKWQEGDPLCKNGDIDPIEPCCELPAPPDQPNACGGDESIENPSSCAGRGQALSYLFTQFEVHEDCNEGYDLDGCNGSSCLQGGLTAAEGLRGVDNGLAGLAPVLEGVAGNLGPVNQGIADAICGKVDWDHETEGCEQDIPKLDLRLIVDAAPEEACAKVTLVSGAVAVHSVAMNLSDDGCLSGQLPNIPLEIFGVKGLLSNVRLRTTLSPAGFSEGVMGVTHDADLTIAMSEGFLSGSAGRKYSIGRGAFFDINQDLSSDNEQACSAMSGTYKVGGVAQ